MKDLKLADLEAAEYVDQMIQKYEMAKERKPEMKPIYSAYFCPDTLYIKQRRVGYYFFTEDKDGTVQEGMAFDHSMDEVAENLEYHKILVNKVQELLANLTNQNLCVEPWKNVPQGAIDLYPNVFI